MEIVKNNIPLSGSAIPDSSYAHLTAWPFAGFVTTNWDNYIATHLTFNKKHPKLLTNSDDDSAQIMEGGGLFVWKYHGDLDAPESVVLDSDDYKRIEVDTKFGTARQKLETLFHMYDVLFVGYSLSDANIKQLLSTGRRVRLLTRPFFMYACDVPAWTATEMLVKERIQVIPYQNPDKNHAQLVKRIELVDHFILSGENERRVLSAPNADEQEAATALFVTRSLRTAEKGGDLRRSDCIAILVLQALYHGPDHKLLKSDLLATEPLKSLAQNGANMETSLNEALKLLEADYSVSIAGESVTLQDAGAKRVEHAVAQRKGIRDHALSDLMSKLAREFAGEVNQLKATELAELADGVLLQTLRCRGLGVANTTIVEGNANREDLLQYFESIEVAARKIEDHDLQDAFVKAAHDFLIAPTTAQRSYITAMAQGFFLYYFSGVDTNVQNELRSHVKSSAWIVDASILIRLMAVGSVTYEGVAHFFELAIKRGLKLFTTSKLVDELQEHYDWAIRTVEMHDVRSIAFLEAVLSKGWYRQNLFLDGFVGLAGKGELGTFRDYLARVWGSVRSGRIVDLLASKGVAVISDETLRKVKVNAQDIFDKLLVKVREDRESRRLFKNDLQIEAEGEVGILIHERKHQRSVEANLDKCERVYFMSDSRVLDRSIEDGVVTWTPYATTQLLTSITADKETEEHLSELLLSEYYYSGISFISREQYLKFFGASINQSKLTYAEQRERYAVLVEEDADVVDEYFNRLDDLEKPAFAEQMAWRVAREASERVEKVEKEKTKLLEQNKRMQKAAENSVDAKQLRRVQVELNTLRNANDPKKAAKRDRKRRNKVKKSKRK